MNSNALTIVLFILYLSCLAGFTFFSQRKGLSQKLQLIRALFPSWHFYDEFSFQPTLFIRAGENSKDLGNWEEALPTHKRHFFNLFWNPQGNLLLAYNTLIAETIRNIKSKDENAAKALAETTEFKLLAKLVTQQLREKGLYFKGMKYQYKICLNSTFSNKVEDEDILVSKVIEV